MNCRERGFLVNFKFSVILIKISIVMPQDGQKLQHTSTHIDLSIENPLKLCRINYPKCIDNSQSELNLTIPTVGQPARALSMNS